MSASNIFLIVSIKFSLQRIEICIDIFKNGEHFGIKNGVFAYLKHEKKRCKNFSQNILLLLLLLYVLLTFHKLCVYMIISVRTIPQHEIYIKTSFYNPCNKN